MPALGQYDGALQMFVEEAREADVAHLRFLRWLVEQGRLDCAWGTSIPRAHGTSRRSDSPADRRPYATVEARIRRGGRPDSDSQQSAGAS